MERALDMFERDHPEIRVVRLRPGFIFKREAATEQRRLFGGPFLPHRLIRPGLVPFVPDTPGLRFQALHADDAGEAYRLAVTTSVWGPFNIAADPVIEPRVLADLLGARLVPAPGWLLHGAASVAWHLRLVPASPDLLDMLLRLPIMDTTRSRTELGWAPAHTAVEAIEAFLEGARSAADFGTPPLSSHTSGPGRIREILTGVGRRP
ncbi:hypothetical protein ACTMTI_34230 [Nonomuraea sp. H19]|uniref:hypothetical protein n=1 Tax=Nonomuraea sp. H19 TaxID=3452206 RepID=UPI003F89D8FD